MKYYLRGFGIGVLFVTILFALIRKPSVMTEEDIRKQAENLGMLTAQEVKEKELSAIQETELKWQEKLKEQEEEYKKLLQQKEEKTAETKEDGTEAANEGAGEENGSEAADEEAGEESEPEAADEENVEESELEAADEEAGEGEPDAANQADSEPEYVQITIVRGMTSERVSAMLQEAGLVDSAEEFNRYLASTGKQSSICVGTYEISTAADYAEIAAVITGR